MNHSEGGKDVSLQCDGLQNKTVGIIGAGRIGTAYARMMAEGHKCNIVYFDPYPNKFLEQYISDYSDLLESKGEPRITCRKIETVEELLQTADVRVPSLATFCYWSEESRARIKRFMGLSLA